MRLTTKLGIDVGHGGPGHPGCPCGPRTEADLVLEYSAEIARQAQAAGLEVVRTRTANEHVSLANRPALLAQAGADVVISLHINSESAPIIDDPQGRRQAGGPLLRVPDPTWQPEQCGLQTFVNPGDQRARELALLLWSQWGEHLPELQGERVEPFLTRPDSWTAHAHQVIGGYSPRGIPAVLDEIGFASWAADREVLLRSSTPSKIGAAVVGAVLAWLSAGSGAGRASER